ncbi:MAG: Bug family tripartite tricarboxylate transporter substrate binding protein, partial [Burkholderiales bacterium]
MTLKSPGGALIGAILLALSGVLGAQDYPNRPIRMVVPFPPGGTPDINARLVAAQMSKQMGQNIVIENRAGASGIIGIDAVAKAEPNGYNVLFITIAMVTNPTAFKKLPYDTVNDFVPVSNIANGIGMLLVVNPALGVDSVKELIARAAKAEKKLTYGSSGVGSGLAIGAQLFEALGNVEMLHVPYKGLPPAVTALLAGEINMMIAPPTIMIQHIKSGKLKALAYTGVTRWPEMPSIPTMVEAGVPRYRYDNFWHALFAPRGTPGVIVARLASEVRR